MRKYSFLISIICLISILAIPLPTEGTDGIYNTFSGLLWCENQLACIHEIGHKIDQDNGWVSQSAEFNDALKIYILSESKKDHPGEFLYKIFSVKEFSSVELYASLFSWADGNPENIPPIFRKFYNWDAARKLINEYAR